MKEQEKSRKWQDLREQMQKEQTAVREVLIKEEEKLKKQRPDWKRVPSQQQRQQREHAKWKDELGRWEEPQDWREEDSMAEVYLLALPEQQDWKEEDSKASEAQKRLEIDEINHSH